MKTLTLTRIQTGKKGTYGVLSDGHPICVTLEDPWRNNQPWVSCIPHGRYVCSQVNSPKFGPTWEAQGVQGRSHILVHRGNTTADTSGCILVGSTFTGSGIGASSKAFEKFESDMPTTFILNIHWAPVVPEAIA